jgi:hypothetical protein
VYESAVGFTGILVWQITQEGSTYNADTESDLMKLGLLLMKIGIG